MYLKSALIALSTVSGIATAQVVTPVSHQDLPAAPVVQSVAVQQGVKLEVLDWGGSGPALVLLAGLGNTAHIFTDFAPMLTPRFHVYGITRRGYGSSSSVVVGFTADRLGDDVVAVLDSLKLKRPILVGHSIAGEELSSIATRYPSRVSGLVYLDAAYPFAYQNPAYPSLFTEFDSFIKEAGAFAPPKPPSPGDLASFEAFQVWFGQAIGVRWPLAELRATFKTDAQGHVAEQKTSASVAESIHNGESRSFNSVPVPALAIYAIPQGHGTSYDQLAAPLRDAFEAKQIKLCGRIADEFQTGVPEADVLRIAHANHYVFISNQAEVLAAIEAFSSKLAAN